MAPRWQRDTWQPAQAVASVNGVMPSDYQMMLPPGTVPQVQQGMPQLPSLSFPRGGGAPQSLPVGDIERTAGKPRPAPARAADRRTTTTRGEGEKGGENRVIPGMAKGGGRIDTPKGEGLDYQRGDKERVAGMLDREREPEAQRNAPSAPRRGTQEKRESNKRVYLPSPQLITGNLADDAEGTSLEQFAMPGAGDMEALMPLLMMMMMSGQGPGMGMPQGMPMGQPGMQGPPMGAMPQMGGQGMPPMPPGMPGMGAGMPPGMHMMPDGSMMPDDEMQMQGAPWMRQGW